MSRSMLVLSLVLFVTLTPACTTDTGTPSTKSTAADEAAIDALYDQFSDAYDRLDDQLVAGLYTDDALYLSGGNGAIRRGHAEIRDGFASMFDWARADERALAISFRSVDRSIEGALAYDVGYYRLVSTPADGDPRVSVGKFTVVLKKQADGAWRFHVDSFSDAPVEAYGE